MEKNKDLLIRYICGLTPDWPTVGFFIWAGIRHNASRSEICTETCKTGVVWALVAKGEVVEVNGEITIQFNYQ